MGTHNTLLGKLSAGIKAFQDDLKQRGIEDKVAGFTFIADLSFLSGKEKLEKYSTEIISLGPLDG